MITLLLLGAAGIAGLLLVEVLLRRTPVAVALVLVVALADSFLTVAPSVQVGPFTVFAGDIALAAIAAAVAGRLLRTSHLTGIQLVLLGLFALVLLSVGRGVMVYGVDVALNEARAHLRFFVAALYFSTMTPSPALLRRVAVAWLAAAGALAVLVLARWAALAAGVAEGVLASPGSPLRVLNADGALMLGQSFLLLAPSWFDIRARNARRLAIVLLLFTIGLQHRTVWVALIVAFAVALVRNAALGRRLVLLTVGLVGAASVMLLTVFGQIDVASSGSALASSATDSGTFAWRVEGWAQLVDDGGDTVVELLVGAPFGGGWERHVNGATIDVSPHNWYVENYLRLGVLGVLTLALLLFALLRGLHRRAEVVRHGALGAEEVLLLLLVTQVVYFITYSPTFEQGIITGVAAAAAGWPRRARHDGAVSVGRTKTVGTGQRPVGAPLGPS